MKSTLAVISFFVLCACAQDGPNIKQIENMQFFIDNKKNSGVIEIEPGLQYSVIKKGDLSGPNPSLQHYLCSFPWNSNQWRSLLEFS
tara:strand:- start:356 stop:616 length:261 start_codon:yes stop_codon:yes gene_type:complete